MSEYPYEICKVELKQNEAAILCESCNKWNHINCFQVNWMNYEKLKSDPTPWCYAPFINKFPFANTSKSDLINQCCSSPSLSVSRKPTVKRLGKKLKELLKEIKDLNIFEQSENLISCDYFKIENLKKAKIKSQNLFILHLNIFPVSSHKRS